MSADSPRRTTRGVPAIVPPQVVSDRSIIDNVAGFINDVALTNQPQGDPKDTIAWARFEQSADISDPTFGDEWEIDGNISPPLLLILGYGLGVQVWAIPANGEAIEVLSWRHGHVTTLRILPTPFSSDDEMADEPIDNFFDKRPLMAICDSSQSNTGSAQTCYSVNFVSLKTGAQVKTIKFKYRVLDVLANRTSVVITFPERIAVFDARTLEDRLSVTSCYPSPGINPNPIALGPRWMAYAENKLLPSKRSCGGCDGDGASSYTATVLNAAKSFGKGLRELGEQMAAGLTGTSSSGLSSKSSSFDSGTGEIRQAGVITILDIKNPIKDISPTTGAPISINGSDPIIAHFIAHSEAIVAMEFDYSGLLLVTADRRGHDFHVFRIQPHPAGSHLAAIHHLYILHRGDTSAKVQNITFALDSRWVAVSTLRGTTHVFPITPYGGAYGFRTHSSLHVVNKLSRFHRSAGLSGDNRSNSPISHSESMTFNQMSMPYPNPTMPPFPRPHTILPLAQLRQPSVLASPPGSAQNISYQKSLGSGVSSNRQRLSSLSDESGKPLSVCAVFAKSRAWLLEPPNVAREAPAHKLQRKAVDSLFIMAGHGALIQYDLDTKLASNVAKEKICDDTPIELEVEAKAQWNLGRRENVLEIQPPLTSDNWLIKDRNFINIFDTQYEECDDRTERWLSQVEIITHAGPHRRLWMGPQFVFKTYNTPSGSSLSHIDSEAIEIGIASTTSKPGRSSPMNMPLGNSGRSAVPVLIESGSYSSIEQSPKLMDRFKHDHLDSDLTLTEGESRLKEDLADAMRESPSVQQKDTGRLHSMPMSNKISTAYQTTNIDKNVTIDPNGGQTNKIISKTSNMTSSMSASLTIKEEVEDNHNETDSTSGCVSIEKIVNPLGTVTTITRSSSDADLDKNPVYDPADHIILENCDESLFRPVVAIFCDEKINKKNDALVNTTSNLKSITNQHNINKNTNNEMTESAYFKKPPEPIGTKLVVPVIEKSITIETTCDSKKSIKVKNSKINQKSDEEKFSNNTPFMQETKIQMKQKDLPELNPNIYAKIENRETDKKVDKINMKEQSINYNTKQDKIKEETEESATTKSEIVTCAEKEDKNIVKIEKNELKGVNKIQNSHKKITIAVNTKQDKNDKNCTNNNSKTTKAQNDNCKLSSEKLKNENDQTASKDINQKNKIDTIVKDSNLSSKKSDDEIFLEAKTSGITKIPSSSKIYENVPQRKPSKDEDSESFESLENMDEYYKNSDKQRKISDNFESAEDCHHESDVSSTYIGSKWEDEDDNNKSFEKVQQKNKFENKTQIVEKVMSESSTSSVEVTITLPKKGKNKKVVDKQNDKKTSTTTTKEKQNIELEFVDKFCHDKTEDDPTIENFNIDIDIKALQDSLHEDEITVSSEIVTIKPNKNKSSNQSKTNFSTKKIIENTKTKNDIKSDDENNQVAEEVNISLPLTANKKKQNKKSSGLQETNKDTETIFKLPLKSITNEIVTNDTNIATKKLITSNLKFEKSNLDFPTLPPLDSLTNDTFLPPLSPLEPFETKFDTFLEINPSKKTEDHISLINFESPESPKTKTINLDEITSIEPKPRGFTKDTLIFALCGSLHYENEDDDEKQMSTSTDKIINTKTDLIESNLKEKQNYNPIERNKSVENIPKEMIESVTMQSKRKNRKKEKNIQKTSNYQASTVNVATVCSPSSSTSSSEETEESSSSAACNKRLQKNIEDDEELRPLIDVSMTQSINLSEMSSTSPIKVSTTTIKKQIKKPKTMSQILKGEIDDDDDEVDKDDADKHVKKVDNLQSKNIEKLDLDVKTPTKISHRTSITKKISSLPNNPKIENCKLIDEPGSSESSDEQLNITQTSNKKSLSTITTITSNAKNLQTHIKTEEQINQMNDDSSESDIKSDPKDNGSDENNSSGTGNESGSGNADGGGNGSGDGDCGDNGVNNLASGNANKNNFSGSNNSNQNNKKKSRKKKR